MDIKDFRVSVWCGHMQRTWTNKSSLHAEFPSYARDMLLVMIHYYIELKIHYFLSLY